MRFLTAAVLVVTMWTTATAADPPTAIEWRRNLLDAFVEAVENKKPLVVLFASRPASAFKDGRHLSNAQWVELDKPEVQALAGKAVFAVCHFDHAAGVMLDSYAEKMRTKLRVTELPTLSVIAPNDKRLVEVYRLVGPFPADEVATDLGRKLPTAVKAEHLAAEAKPRPVAKTPTEAVALWEAVMRDGDPDRLGEVLTPAAAEAFARCLEAATACGHAKRRLLAALDERFGKKDDTVPHADDDDGLLREMANVDRFEVVSADADGDTATVKTRLIDRTGNTRQVELVAEKTAGGWKLVPADFAKLMDPVKQKKHLAAVRARAAAFDAIAKRVRAGEFATREAAKEAAGEAARRKD